MILYAINVIFTTYSFMLLARILGSWLPRFAKSRFMRFLGFYTDPYLNVFRRIIPPLGVLDLSPMVGFIALQMLQVIVMAFLR